MTRTQVARRSARTAPHDGRGRGAEATSADRLGRPGERRVRGAAHRRRGGAGPAVRRDRPARAAAARVGPRRRRRRARPVRRRVRRRVRRARRLVKPQSAFFERHGSRGIAVLERLLAAFAGTSTLVLLDVKRGDIGSTMQGYADAYLAPGAPLAADAVTLSPFLGFGSLAPALDTAAAAGRGVFVLARTSNAEGAAVQAAVADGRSVAQGDRRRGGGAQRGCAPLGAVGLVVGATADHGLDLARAERPGARPRPRRAGRGPADIAARFRGVRRPRAAVGEPLGPRGGPGRRPPPRRRRGAARRGSHDRAEPVPYCGDLRRRGRRCRDAGVPLVAARGPIGERSVTVCWPPVTVRLRGVVVEVRRLRSRGRHPPVGAPAGASVRALGA